MDDGQAQLIHERIHEIPPPAAKEPGWYPDPLGSTWERYWDGTWLELTRAPQTQLASELPSENGRRLWGGRSLRPPHGFIGHERPAQQADQRAPWEAWTRKRAERKRLAELEARKQAFFETPAGRARLSFGQNHRLFQCELFLTRPTPIIIPGVEGTSPQWTADPVDIINSVVAEGWKLVAGSFIHGDGRGTVGYYLFKRSKKRRRKMNDPWKAPAPSAW